MNVGTCIDCQIRFELLPNELGRVKKCPDCRETEGGGIKTVIASFREKGLPAMTIIGIIVLLIMTVANSLVLKDLKGSNLATGVIFAVVPLLTIIGFLAQ